MKVEFTREYQRAEVGSLLSSATGDFSWSRLGCKLIQYAIDVFVAVRSTKPFGQFHAFINGDAIRDAGVVDQLKGSDTQNGVFDWAQFADFTINEAEFSRFLDQWLEHDRR